MIVVLLAALSFASFAAAQEPAAAAAPEAPPVAKLESDDPSVQALLSTKPSTPKDLFEVTNLLNELGQPELARAMLVKLIDTATAPEQLVEIGRTFGKREVLRLGEVPGLQPEGKPFADKVIAAMNASDRDPARIAGLIQQLQDPSYDARIAAINNLRAGGDGAIDALLEGMFDPNRGAEHLMLQTALAAFGEPALGPARAMIASGDEAMSLAGVRLPALIEGRDATLDLSAAAYGRSTPPAVRQAALAALAKRRGTTTNPAEIASQLYLAADHLYKLPRTDPAPLVVTWNWDAAQQKPTANRLPQPVSDYRRAAGYADTAYELTKEAPARNLALAASLEAGLIAELDPTQWGGVAEAWSAARKPTPAELSAVYQLAVSWDRIAVAAVCIDRLGTTAEALISLAPARPTTLVAAAASPDPTIRFVAVKAILKLKPTQPFAGSSGVAQSLAWLASSDGVERALVVDPHTERGLNFAAMLHEMRLQTEVVNNVREGLDRAAAQADVQIIFVDRMFLEPSSGSFLANLRRDFRTACTPVVVVCEPEDLDRTRTRWYADPYTSAIIRPRDGATLMTQLQMMPNPGRKEYVIPPERQGRAVWALNAMRDVLESNSKVFDLRSYESVLLPAANSPTRGLAAVGALGQFGSPAAQRTLADVASETTRPLELRQAATASFIANVRRFGKLLTTEQIARQYERYNASETLDKPTQQLLGLLLDALEGKSTTAAATPAAEPVPAVPAPADASAPASDPAPAATPPASAPSPAATP